MRHLLRVATLFAVIGIGDIALSAQTSPQTQTVTGVVVDQTGLPLPGVAIQILDGTRVVTTLTTGADGTFALDPTVGGDTVTATLDGFETARVGRADAARITLAIARATETTTVTATTISDPIPTAPLLGSTLTATNIARLPSSRMRARESLPLLPSVLRGPDGLMRLGGAQAHETPLVIDGFNVTDPATGISTLNLPFEAVRGVDVLRDPMSVNYGGLLGGVVKMETAPGGDKFAKGLQGFIPRPRFTSPNVGRIEGIFPRAFVSGSTSAGRIRYFVGGEYDYERIPVPNVSSNNGPEVIEDSGVLFTRLDAQLTGRHHLGFEVFFFPSRTQSYGLSPRRDQPATADVTGKDFFAGMTHRFVANQSSVLTIQIGAFRRAARVAPNGNGISFLAPSGWQNNWFISSSRTASRVSGSVAWERITTLGGRTHDVTVSAELAATDLNGSLAENAIKVNDQDGNLVRTVDFGPAETVSAHDFPSGAAIRDVWHVTDRVQLDLGVRADYSRYGGATPSSRAGLRWEMTEGGTTVLKAGIGTFVGNLPLLVPAYRDYPARTDQTLDAATGEVLTSLKFTPTTSGLRLPQARAITVGLERQLAPRLDGQVSATIRDSSRLATLGVPTTGGALTLASTGTARYREVQVSVRRTWERDQQLFISYVRSASEGELNDFSAVFRTLGVPLVQPGGISRLTTDAPHRLLVWGTFNLPKRMVISPVSEWRSGFPFSAFNSRYLYSGTPNSRNYPAFFSTDLVVYKTVTYKGRTADLGVQAFNITNHQNPRDVYSVVGAPRYGEFTNSVGPIFRGYMLIKW
jgi:hypothetical protein